MSGITVMFGIMTRYYIILITLFSSCGVSESSMCDLEKLYFSQEWNFIVKKSYRDYEYNATYVLESNTGEKIFFAPKQWINTMAEPGDRVIKKRRSAYAFLITRDHDTIESRIYSPTCDKLVSKITHQISR